MTDEREKEMRKIWEERATGMPVERIAQIHGISEQKVRDALNKAPKIYVKQYDDAGSIPESAYKAIPPHRRHDK